MIKEMRGLPGVMPSRLEEAQTIRHCALSLVGATSYDMMIVGIIIIFMYDK